MNSVQWSVAVFMSGFGMTLYIRDKTEVKGTVLVIRCCLSTWKGKKLGLISMPFSTSIYMIVKVSELTQVSK